MNEFINLLTENGFIPGNQMEAFGRELPVVYYFFKKRNNIHEYVSLVSYQGKFVEAVYELFAAKKSPYRAKGTNWIDMAKKGQIQLIGYLPRSLGELEQKINKTDTEIKEIADKFTKQLELSQKSKK